MKRILEQVEVREEVWREVDRETGYYLVVRLFVRRVVVIGREWSGVEVG